MFSKLSIIIPFYNEAKYVSQVIQKVIDTKLEYPLAKDIILVDDGSTDGSLPIVKAFIEKCGEPIRILVNDKNSGKGASISKALGHVAGEIVVIQDADLEYDPADYNKMLKPIWEYDADVVYGTRFKEKDPGGNLYYFHRIGNKFLTGLSNLFTHLDISDMECGYKMFRKDVIQQVKLKEKRFGFEPEVTAKVSRVKNVRITETSISYNGRTYSEGKKISWRDGLRAVYCIFKYNVFSRK